MNYLVHVFGVVEQMPAHQNCATQWQRTANLGKLFQLCRLKEENNSVKKIFNHAKPKTNRTQTLWLGAIRFAICAFIKHGNDIAVGINMAIHPVTHQPQGRPTR